MQCDDNDFPTSADAYIWMRLGRRRAALLMLHVHVARSACVHALVTQQDAAHQDAARQRLVRAYGELYGVLLLEEEGSEACD